MAEFPGRVVFPNGSCTGWPTPPTLEMRLASVALAEAAHAVDQVPDPVFGDKLCPCGCGTQLRGKQKTAGARCRMKLMRQRSETSKKKRGVGCSNGAT